MKKKLRKPNLKEIIAIIFVLAVFGFFILYSLGQEKVACTQDAKLCPDGNYVSRVAPDCNFEPCPVSKICETNEDCLVFGTDGDCNCGCFNKDALPQEPVGNCFCAAPKSCECVDGECEGVF